jgi:hypothetical protein
MEFRNVLIKHTKSPLFKEKCARSNRRLAMAGLRLKKLVLYLKIKSLTERLASFRHSQAAKRQAVKTSF